MKKQLLLFVMMMLPLVASAHDIEVKNVDGVTIYYNYIKDGTELEVTFIGGSYGYDKYTGKVVIPDEVTFMNRTRKVTSIGDYAFYACSDLTSVTIPNNMTSIGSGAFSGCRGLTSVIIGNNVKSIGKSAFNDCISITSVTIPNSVTSIGEDAFFNCSCLEKVIVSDIAAWCNIKFYNVTANPLFGTQHLYSDENTEITNLVIPNNVTSIGDYAFYACSALTSVIIGKNVTSIGNLAFRFCSKLTSVTIGNSVTSIGSGAFSDCTCLNSITIPNSVTSIGGYAFNECSALTSVIIGKNVTSIGESAFVGADIPTVISLIEKPFTINGKASSNWKTFSLNTFNNATLYVPKGTIDKYKATNGWKDFVFIEEGNGGSVIPPTPEKCEKPTIGYSNGKLTFTSSTDGATCQYSITDSDIKTGSGSEVQLTVTYHISVYATKSGYQNSDVATATLCWIDQQPRTEGITNSIAQVPANAVLIQSNDGILTIQGTDDGTPITVYTINGTLAGLAISKEGQAIIDTNLQTGTVAIVKIGQKSVKVVVK